MNTFNYYARTCTVPFHIPFHLPNELNEQQQIIVLYQFFHKLFLVFFISPLDPNFLFLLLPIKKYSRWNIIPYHTIPYQKWKCLFTQFYSVFTIPYFIAKFYICMMCVKTPNQLEIHSLKSIIYWYFPIFLSFHICFSVFYYFSKALHKIVTTTCAMCIMHKKLNNTIIN